MIIAEAFYKKLSACSAAANRSRRTFGTKIVHGRQMQAGVLVGAKRLGRAVEATLGPGGRNVVIDPFQESNFNQFSAYPKPIITKDGVTVARNISLLSNKLHNIGSRLMIDAAE